LFSTIKFNILFLMTEVTVFKNKPILVITDEKRKYRRLSVGVFKANLILKNIEAIKKFVEENSLPSENNKNLDA